MRNETKSFKQNERRKNIFFSAWTSKTVSSIVSRIDKTRKDKLNLNETTIAAKLYRFHLFFLQLISFIGQRLHFITENAIECHQCVIISTLTGLEFQKFEGIARTNLCMRVSKILIMQKIAQWKMHDKANVHC